MAALAESAGMIVEAEILRYFVGRRPPSSKAMMTAQRFLMRRRGMPEGPADEMLSDLVRREFVHLSERVRPDGRDDD